MRLFVLLAVVLSFFAAPVYAQQNDLVIDLPQQNIDITTGFSGAMLPVYGVVRGQGNLAIVLEGPRRTMVVRRKEEIMGAWMNRQSMMFKDVPGFYSYALSASEDDIANAAIRRALHIGPDSLDTYLDTDEDEQEAKRFKEALIRNEQSAGLFALAPRPITNVHNGFFKTEFRLPSNVPTGNYLLTAYLIRGDDIIAQDKTGFRVAQVGFSARIYSFAMDHSLTYGFMAVLIAALTGWSAYAFLRRD